MNRLHIQHVPTSPTQVAFDAFILEGQVLYILQFTIAASLKGLKHGFLITISKRIEAQQLNVVLPAPRIEPTLASMWVHIVVGHQQMDPCCNNKVTYITGTAMVRLRSVQLQMA
jgi:hypothetical protein